VAILRRVGLEAGEEIVVSWLPLYHDMGLIGFLALALVGAKRLVLASPETFVLSPGSWMELVSKHQGTVTGGPSFAYALASRKLVVASDLDLSHLRVALNGGEPVDVDVAEQFIAAARKHGMDERAMMPV